MRACSQRLRVPDGICIAHTRQVTEKHTYSACRDLSLCQQHLPGGYDGSTADMWRHPHSRVPRVKIAPNSQPIRALAGEATPAAQTEGQTAEKQTLLFLKNVRSKFGTE